jgi:radical SAM superfamily enzyme YgiQ (UPF0313 family)
MRKEGIVLAKNSAEKRENMKVLLVAVNAKYIHSNLAVYYLGKYAAKYKENIKIAEYTINHLPDEILKGIYQEQADVVAFSCYIWNIEMITQVVTELRKVQPEAKIWFGGPEVSYNAGECLRSIKALDGVIVGEGEQTFLELMEYYVDQKGTLDQIKGIAYKRRAQIEGEAIITTPARMPIPLDSVPFPYEDMERFRNKIIYYESSRGCPFSCSYCLSSIDKKVRLRSLNLVKQELKIFLDYKVAQVKFVDRTFNCNKKHAMGIWQFIKEHDNGITNFHFEISGDLLEDEEIEFLKTLRPGQVQFEIGVQSTNPETIATIHRKTDYSKLCRNVMRIHEGHNIHQHLDLIAGLPLEDYASFLKSFDDVYALRPDQFQLGFLKVLKGSFMEEDSSNHQIVYQDRAPYEVLMTDRLSYGEVLKLKGICEMVEVYYNSGQFRYSMEFLEHFFPRPSSLYYELSQYYERNGLNRIAHTRLKRYELLLDFYKEVVLKLIDQRESEKYTGAFEEILLLDLYLRENIKSRPGFAHKALDYSTMREVMDTLGIDRRNAHVEQFTYDVITACRTGQPIRKEVWIAFDYSQRDPLSKAAKMIIAAGK